MGRAIDSYGAIANVTTSVIVSAVANFNPTTYLSSSLTASLASGSASSVYQSINAVSSMISAINCTAAPNCTTLHRGNCHNTANTCGSCLQGYTGIVGDSNVRCQSPSTIATAASGCTTNTDCLYGACVSGVCITPNKACPTATPDTVCSGQGLCQFLDTSGSVVSSCLISNVYCSSQCVCSGGYGGVDCSLNPSQLAARFVCCLIRCLIQTLFRSSHIHPFDTSCHHILSTHPLNVLSKPSQHNLSTLFVNTRSTARASMCEALTKTLALQVTYPAALTPSQHRHHCISSPLLIFYYPQRYIVNKTSR